MKKILPCLILMLVGSTICAAELTVGRFSAGDLSGWTDKVFKRRTEYMLVSDNGKTVLKAHSRDAASGLIKKVDLDPKSTPILRWSWKVDHTLTREDVTKKTGDDFAARVYVVFPRVFFWRMRAINYVWAAKLPQGSAVPSPYTANAIIVAVESGDGKAGTWVSEHRNIYEDYRKFFGEEPPRLGGVAIMTDTDDTKDEATAWYGDIFLESAPKEATGKSPAPIGPGSGISERQPHH
jgi:hypothetical protein